MHAWCPTSRDSLRTNVVHKAYNSHQDIRRLTGLESKYRKLAEYGGSALLRSEYI